MQNLIDYNVFTGSLQIANAVTDTDVNNIITNTIAEWQDDFLTKVLGPQLYKQFAEWYAIDPTDDTNAFFYLLNGADLECGQWVGLRKPLACYVYFYYQRNNATQTTSPGEAKTNSQNAYRMNPYDKQKTAWDRMAGWIKGYYEFMEKYYGAYVATVSIVNPLPYHAPAQTIAGTTAGVVTGTNTFTFDGTAGTIDWRGYDVYPERIGQGTLANANYSWNKTTGVFTLLQPGDVFTNGEIFNFTFGLGGTTFLAINSNSWQSYRHQFLRLGFTKVINPF